MSCNPSLSPMRDAPPLYCLAEDAPLFAKIENRECENENLSAHLPLAPLDPLIYDRRVTATLWGYDYTREVYTPPCKRTRGHYALPLRAGHEIVTHVDPKADRAAGRLRILARSVRRGHASAAAARSLAAFLGLK